MIHRSGVIKRDISANNRERGRRNRAGYSRKRRSGRGDLIGPLVRGASTAISITIARTGPIGAPESSLRALETLNEFLIIHLAAVGA